MPRFHELKKMLKVPKQQRFHLFWGELARLAQKNRRLTTLVNMSIKHREV